MSLPINELSATVNPEPDSIGLWARARRLMVNQEFLNLGATVFSTLSVFGIFFLQGIFVARILGPIGRGEFGTALYFPRDILLYAGLLGGVEIINSIASKRAADTVALKYAAARLGLVSGLITAVVAALLSVGVLLKFEKEYLIPFCLIVCAFVPFEHMQLTVSAVDRGVQRYGRYNINRLIYAASFLVMVLFTFGLDEVTNSTSSLPSWVSQIGEQWTGINHLIPLSSLWLMCALFVSAKIIGLLPTFRGMNILERIRSGESRSGEIKDAPSTRTLLKEGQPYAVSMIVSEVFDRLDILLILAWATVEMSGHYFVAVPAAALLTVFPNALGVFTFNVGAEQNRQVTLKVALIAILSTIAFQLAATIAFMYILPHLILFFCGEVYSPAIPFALWLLPACAIKGYLQAADGYLKGCGKPKIGIVSRSLSIALMLVFVAFTFPKWQFLSIPMAACVGQGFSMIVITAAVIKDVVSKTGREGDIS
jgi:O-antigen/teichoic acid export membrane protein